MDKVTRMLILYEKIRSGDQIMKTSFCNLYKISERTFERDIEDLRCYLSDAYTSNELLYDKTNNTYQVDVVKNHSLTAEESVAIIKLICSSGQYRKDEVEGMLSSVVKATDSFHQKDIWKLASHEFKEYDGQNKEKAILKMQFDLQKCISNAWKIKIENNHQKENTIIIPTEIKYTTKNIFLLGEREDGTPCKLNLHDITGFTLVNKSERR